MLSLYRAALRLRRDNPGFATDAFRWLPSPEGTLLFERGAGLRCAVNLLDRQSSLSLPSGASILVSSEALAGNALPPNAAAWFATAG
jgi:alpha-glucosidase